MKHLGRKPTPAYCHPRGRPRMRDIVTKGHKAKERELCRAEIESQLSDFPPEEMRAMARLEAWEDANPNWLEQLCEP